MGQGHAPTHTSPAQDAILSRMRDAAGPGTVGVFDLDGCLFDNRARQVRIIHEYAARVGPPGLGRVRPHHFVDWDLAHTLHNAGVPADLVPTIVPGLLQYWTRCFFSSAYVRHDLPMPGGTELVRHCRAAGMKIVYLTGRDASMGPGTRATLRKYGFPLDGDNARLMLKPTVAEDDTAFKARALVEIATLGTPTLFVDNEPANINLFADTCPDALTVFLASDHSFRPDRPHPHLPQIRSFLRQA